MVLWDFSRHVSNNSLVTDARKQKMFFHFILLFHHILDSGKIKYAKSNNPKVLRKTVYFILWLQTSTRNASVKLPLKFSIKNKLLNQDDSRKAILFLTWKGKWLHLFSSTVSELLLKSLTPVW